MDHVTPLHKGGTLYDPLNLQTLCAFPCHAEKTRTETMSPERLAWDRLLQELQENIA